MLWKSGKSLPVKTSPTRNDLPRGKFLYNCGFNNLYDSRRSLLIRLRSIARGNFFFETENITLTGMEPGEDSSRKISLTGYLITVCPLRKSASISFSDDNRSCFDKVNRIISCQMKYKKSG